ncbi:hypothetical protein [Peribacillus frigoritolerans]|uniref:hypothetical protein n=1 Tax=Peribacillus frigoritolerans TaxID=450367 RepID=UPI00178C2B22|nr:hypothetical protein [Peribacillus frigoritolerans]
MKFEVISDALLPKTPVSENKERFLLQNGTYEVPFLLYVYKVVKLLWKNQKN